MKKLIVTSLILLSAIVLNAQKQLDIDTLTHAKMINKDLGKILKNYSTIGVYIAIDKNIYKIGDTIILNTPTGGNISAFNTKQKYNYVFYGSPAGVLLKGLRFVEQDYKGNKLVIRKMTYNKGSFGMPNTVFIETEPLKNTKFSPIDKYISIKEFDEAVNKSEIIPQTLSRPLTRDEAMSLLKKKKDELDLELISKDDYEKIKNDLMPILKNN